jgi:hypothetical protein
MIIQLSICAPVGSSASDSPLSSSEKADSILLNRYAIHAVNDIKPYPEGQKLAPFMYWDADVDGTSAALALIKRYVVVTMSSAILVFLNRNLMLRDNQQHTS